MTGVDAMRGKDLADEAGSLLCLLEKQAEAIRSEADIARLRGELIRGCARLANAVDAAGYDRAVAGETLSALREACRRLMAGAEARRRKIAAEMAAVRRGRMGLKKYGPDSGAHNGFVRVSV